MVGGVADREHDAVPDDPERDHELKFAEPLEHRVGLGRVGDIAGDLAGQGGQRQAVGLERERDELAAADLLPFERLGKVGAGLCGEAREHLDSLELLPGGVRLGRVESPHEVGHDEQVDVFRERAQHEPRLQFFRREFRLGDLQRDRLDARRWRGTGVEVEFDVELDPLTAEGGPERLLKLRGQLHEGDAGGLSIEEGVGGDHVGEEGQGVGVFGELHQRVDEGQRTARRGALLVE